MADGQPYLWFEIDGREYRIEKFMLAEARAIQRVTGKTYADALEAANDGDMECLAAVLWVIFKRERPTLTFEEMDSLDVDIASWHRLGGPQPADDNQDQGAVPVTAGATGNGQGSVPLPA
jgi:hypothetical protein